MRTPDGPCHFGKAGAAKVVSEGPKSTARAKKGKWKAKKGVGREQ